VAGAAVVVAGAAVVVAGAAVVVGGAAEHVLQSVQSVPSEHNHGSSHIPSLAH
jgi:hypothetical protein